MKISEIKREAREALTGKWGKGALIVLAYLIIGLAIGFIINLFDENSLIGFILAIIEVIITIPLNLGITYAFLKLKRNEDIKVFGFVDIAVDNFSRAWCITGRIIQKMILPVIALVVSILIYAGIVIYSAMQLAVGVVETVGFATILGILIYIISMTYFVTVYLLYSLSILISHDNADMTALELVNESARLMKGNRGKLVLLELSFIGWAILSVFSLGIGVLWLIPYMQVATVCFYEKLSQPRANENCPIKEM